MYQSYRNVMGMPAGYDCNAKRIRVSSLTKRQSYGVLTCPQVTGAQRVQDGREHCECSAAFRRQARAV